MTLPGTPLFTMNTGSTDSESFTDAGFVSHGTLCGARTWKILDSTSDESTWVSVAQSVSAPTVYTITASPTGIAAADYDFNLIGTSSQYLEADIANKDVSFKITIFATCVVSTINQPT